LSACYAPVVRRRAASALGACGGGSDHFEEARFRGMQDHKYQENRRHAIWGWILFVVCALFFMAAGWRNRDLLTFVGSVVFLVACLFFLLPLVREGINAADRE
jgi:hypothetical protein